MARKSSKQTSTRNKWIFIVATFVVLFIVFYAALPKHTIAPTQTETQTFKISKEITPATKDFTDISNWKSEKSKNNSSWEKHIYSFESSAGNFNVSFELPNSWVQDGPSFYAQKTYSRNSVKFVGGPFWGTDLPNYKDATYKELALPAGNAKYYWDNRFGYVYFNSDATFVLENIPFDQSEEYRQLFDKIIYTISFDIKRF